MPAPQPELREARRRRLVEATRELFDSRGSADVPVEEIAQAVGIARGLIYREFTSKEELVVMTITGYTRELAGLLEVAITSAGPEPPAQLERCVEAFAGFCRRYPAFLEGQARLMGRPAGLLQADVGDEAWLALGTAMAACLGPLTDVLREGAAAGVFPAVEDPPLAANVLWTQMVGAMHLARLQVGVRRTRRGGPALFDVTPEAVVGSCVRSAMASVGWAAP